MYAMKLRCAFALVSALSIAGCGLYTPHFEEFWGTTQDTDDKIRLVVRQVECELRRAVQLIESEDIKRAREGLNNGARRLQWLEGWVVDVALLLTIEEKSALSPGISINTPLRDATSFFAAGSTVTTPQSYAFGIGGQFSSDAYRQDKLHIPYRVADLVGPEKLLPPPKVIIERPCVTGENANASLFLQSDLQIYEWLNGIANLQLREQADLRVANAFASDGVMSHQVKFEIVSEGNLTPVWKLVRVSPNTNTPFFDARRDRTQDLIITLGPGSGKEGATLKQAGQNSAFASELSASFRSGIRSGVTSVLSRP
jgi:hypothetical protein